MTTVRLQNGPCDPREVEMRVSLDATELRVRPMPFEVADVYAVVDRFVDRDMLTHVTGEYLRTEGARPAVNQYRTTLGRLGAGRAFAVKRKGTLVVH